MRLRREKNYWQQDIRKREVLKGIVQGTALTGAAGYLCYGSGIGAFLFLPLTVIYLVYYCKELEKKRKREFGIQLKDMMQSVANALKLGYSVENALLQAQKDLDKLYSSQCRINRELQYMRRQLEMNVPAEQVLEGLAKRTGHEDVRAFTTVMVLARRNGGDLVEVLQNAIRQLCERMEVKKEIEVVYAAKKMEFYVMSGIPAGMIAYMKLCFPQFMEMLYGTAFGMIFMTVCLAVYVSAFLWGKRIIEIEV